MDARWKPLPRDSARSAKIIWHPTSSIYEARRGVDAGSDTSVDLSDYVTSASHSQFDAEVSFSFNRELFGVNQPQPNHVLEIQLQTSGEWKPVWFGVIDAISQYTLQRGTRSMQLIAKSRDSQDIWRNTQRVTPLFPQMTDYTYMAQIVARSAGMKHDEIALPHSSYSTAHSNTQMAGMNAWDMVENIFIACGWTPFIDGLGRLRAADRGLQGRKTDIKLTDDRILKVGGSRQRPPKSRVRVLWLNPMLKMHKRMGQLLYTVPVTLGWFTPLWWTDVYFSDDKTQRAVNTSVKGNPGVNKLLPVVIGGYGGNPWKQRAPNMGRLKFVSFQWALMVGAIAAWNIAHQIPDGVGMGGTIPIGRRWEGAAQLVFTVAMMSVGEGRYEVWGEPYDFVHARNISEAFDSSVPTWVDNSVDIECDFVMNEPHAKAIAIRELIYQARAASKWQVTIVDDPRVEYGDILEFEDGTQLYVEDFRRRLERGAEAILEISGFVVGPIRGLAGNNAIQGQTPPGIPPVSGPSGGYTYLAIEGGWEGDARPDGEYVVLMGTGADSHLRTRQGRVNHPSSGLVRYPRITPVGPFKIAGQTDRIVEWSGGGWQEITPDPIAAMSAVIYDGNGTLHMIDRDVHASAQGWRYVDYYTNQPVIGEVTAPTPEIPLHEWTDLGDGWFIGQGGGGCQIRTPELTLLQVHSADAMFIRAQRFGDRIGVTCYERPIPVAHFWWFTLQDARNRFPVVG